MDLRQALGDKFDPEAKYEMFDSAVEGQIVPRGSLVARIPDPNNRRELLVFDMRGETPKAAPAAPAPPAPKRGFTKAAAPEEE